ncbi:MAG TPA: DoxX family protein [Stellaceae bacterium]|nr:DoxX family protein [Stellaceae bacterium]
MASPSLASPRRAPSGRRPRPIVPGLAGFYDWVEPYTYPLFRLIVGAFLLPHGLGKLMSGQAPVVATMTHFGVQPAAVMALCVTAIESLGALCIVLGFLTRLWAAALAIELAVISFVVMLPQGYFRAEPFLLWGLLAFVIALKGGGRCSIDRLIGWEL